MSASARSASRTLAIAADGGNMTTPFTSLQASIGVHNERIISWNLEPKAAYPDNFILQVENSRAGGPWEVLDNTLADNCFFIDDRRRNYNKYMNECYRLRLTIPHDDAADEVYVSDVIQAGQFKAYPFSSEAANVIRQAEKAIELSGVTGVLLKKKHWGVRCKHCTDFDDQMTVNEHCPWCLGTGIEGGFYNGISMAIIKDKISRDEHQGDDCVEESEEIQGRCIAYPWIRYGDVWVEDGTNKRYMVAGVTPSATYKEIDLIYTIKLTKIEYTDIMFSKAADAKVEVKDLWDSSKVEYTPELEKTLEDDTMEQWEDDDFS